MYIRSLLDRWQREETGAVALMFGVSVIVLITIAGVAIDSSRVYNVATKADDALDAAALASAKLLDDEAATDAEFQAVAENYVNAYLKRNRVDHVTWSNIRAFPNRIDSSVTVTVDISMPALFGKVSNNFAKFEFTPTSTVVYRPKKIEMALVLDITGSMCDVPPAFAADACSNGAKISALKSAANQMVDTMAATTPLKDAIRISVVPYSASVNAGAYADLVSASKSTDGCVVERVGVASYTDAAPIGAGALGTSSVAQNPSYSCPSAEVLPLTDISDTTGVDTVKDAINALKGFGGTAGHLGAAWGWYTLSPSWSTVWPSASRPKDYDKDKIIKVVVLMTDGMFNTAYRNGGESFIWPDIRTGDKSLPGTSGYQALKICENIRNKNGEAQLYTIGFQTPVEAEILLKECSGDATFFSAGSASQLIDAFKSIANKLTMLRVAS